jgi:hypothetical protein
MVRVPWRDDHHLGKSGREATVTTLTGALTDMAALMGVLNTVCDLGFALLNVERLAG